MKENGTCSLALLSFFIWTFSSLSNGLKDTVKMFGMQEDIWKVPSPDVYVNFNLSKRIPSDHDGEYTIFSICYWAKPTSLSKYETHISLADSIRRRNVLHLYRQGFKHGYYYNGVKQQGFLGDLITPIDIHSWTYYCHIFQKGLYTIYTNGIGRGEGLIDSKIASVSLKSMISIGQSHDFLSGRYTVDNSFRGYIAQVNIWDMALSAEEIKLQATCQQNMLGNIFSTDREDVDILGAHVEVVDVRTFCQKQSKYFIIPQLQNLEDSKLSCKSVGSNMYIPRNAAENTRLHEKSLQFFRDCNKNYNLWIGVTDDQKEGEWHTFDDNSVIEYTPFELMEPNGGDNENCILMNFNSGLWIDVSCTSEWTACVPCEVDSQRPLQLRGLCFETEAESFFEVFDDQLNFFHVYGYYGYIIYGTKDGIWEMHDTTLNVTVAVLDAAPGATYPIGRKLWTLKRPMCNLENGSKVQLSLTSCNNSEFSCSNGDCIPREKRCDDSDDCPDFSDEINCSFVNIPLGYRLNHQPQNDTIGEPIHLKTAIHIIKFVDINVVDQTVNLGIKLEVTWIDSRLQFLNLYGMNGSKLSVEDMAAIWQPFILFPNAYGGKTDLIQKEITVEKFGPPLPPDFNDLWMSGLSSLTSMVVFVFTDTVYNGSYVDIAISYLINGRFICNFDFFYYPFDVQCCSVFIQLTSVTKEQVTFNQNLSHIQYQDNHELAEYALSDCSVSSITEGNNITGYSKLQVELILQRRWMVMVLNVYLPTLMLEIIGYSTLFIDFATIDVRLAVSLTTLLVLYTLSSNTSNFLPITAYVKMIDIWFFYCIFLLFCITLSNVVVEYLRMKRDITIQPLHRKTRVSQPRLKMWSACDFLKFIRYFFIPALVAAFNIVYWCLIASSF